MADAAAPSTDFSWRRLLPFTRLFDTFTRALGFTPLALSFLAVVLIYIAGRLLDAAWVNAGGGALVSDGAVRSEVQAFATRPRDAFEEWRAAIERQNIELTARLDERRAEYEPRRTAGLTLLRERFESGLKSIAASDRASRLKAHESARLRGAYDELTALLSGYARGPLLGSESDGGRRGAAAALSTLLAADAALPAADRAQQERDLQGLLDEQSRLTQALQRQPRGPFATVLAHLMHSFSATAQAVTHGRWLAGGHAYSPEPAVIASLSGAGSGVLWLLTQRPLYFFVFGLLTMLILARFGGAACRYAAVHATRDEALPLRATLSFASEKYWDLCQVVVTPLGIFALMSLALLAMGVVGAIPWLGEVLGGALFFLALLLGVALTFSVLLLAFAFHLMWPTIAVENSDGFDGVSRAASYLFQRLARYGFYALTLVVTGAAAFLVLRAVTVMLLKLTHSAVDAGMSFGGMWSSGRTESFTKLQAMWSMPAWQDLPLIPSPDAPPFWGEFAAVPVTGTEWFGGFLVACWVFTVVGLLGAYVLSFYFCGCTQAYLLLRNDLDGVELDEVYYEDFEEPAPAAPAPASTTPPGGAALPVLGTAQTPPA